MSTSPGNYLEDRIAEKEAKVKSPILAAILGFLFAPLGFFYVGKYLLGVLSLLMECLFFLLAVIGIGVFMWLIAGVIIGYMCYKEADRLNTVALRRVVEARRQVP